jgi:hypothetical protein
MSNKKREIPDIANTVDDFSKGGNTYVSLPSILEKRGKDRKTITRFRNEFWKRYETYEVKKQRARRQTYLYCSIADVLIFR